MRDFYTFSQRISVVIVVIRRVRERDFKSTADHDRSRLISGLRKRDSELTANQDVACGSESRFLPMITIEVTSLQFGACGTANRSLSPIAGRFKCNFARVGARVGFLTTTVHHRNSAPEGARFEDYKPRKSLINSLPVGYSILFIEMCITLGMGCYVPVFLFYQLL